MSVLPTLTVINTHRHTDTYTERTKKEKEYKRPELRSMMGYGIFCSVNSLVRKAMKHVEV